MFLEITGYQYDTPIYVLGGRITLIKDSLSNLPMYYVSLFKMPKVGLTSLGCISWSFLCDRHSDAGKLHLMN